MYIIIRIILGALFVFSGFEKLITPYQNFLYVIQSYAMLPFNLEWLTARAMPWIELFLGIFLIVGLWLPYTLSALRLLILIFIIAVGQALFRNLPITECGCFGEALSFPLPVVLIFDTGLFLLTGFLFHKITRVKAWSLDQYFEHK